MKSKSFDIFCGSLIWKKLKKRYRIDDNSVVICLPENNDEWNSTAIKYLSDYMKKKNSSRAVILCGDDIICDSLGVSDDNPDYSCVVYDAKKIQRLLDYYCLHQFSDKIVFLYLDQPQDNKSQYILDTTEVSIDELICHSFYRLRKVPEHV